MRAEKIDRTARLWKVLGVLQEAKEILESRPAYPDMQNTPGKIPPVQGNQGA